MLSSDKIKPLRLALLGLLVFFSLLILGISGNLISLYGGAAGAFIPTFLGLDLAMAVITLVIVVPSLAIDFFRKGAFTSMVIVEIGWAGLLMVFWVAAAGTSSGQLAFLPVSCNFVVDGGGIEAADAVGDSVCRQAQALEAFSWLNFFIVFGWLIALSSLATTQHSRGNTTVWKSSVTGTDFMAPASKGQAFNQIYQTTPAQSFNQTYQNTTPGQPMQQQFTGYSQGYPPTNNYNPNAASV